MKRIVLPILAAVVLAAVAAYAWLATHRFAERDLDRRPYPLHAVWFDEPRTPEGLEAYGKLRLEIDIGADGRVERVEEVGQSTLPGAFRESARKAFADVGWEPGRKCGLKVHSLKVVEVNYAPPPGLGEVSPKGR